MYIVLVVVIMGAMVVDSQLSAPPRWCWVRGKGRLVWWTVVTGSPIVSSSCSLHQACPCRPGEQYYRSYHEGNQQQSD